MILCMPNVQYCHIVVYSYVRKQPDYAVSVHRSIQHMTITLYVFTAVHIYAKMDDVRRKCP